MPRGQRSSLKVVMNGLLVGRLHAAPRGLLTFSYAESWLSSEVGRPISLSMPLAGRQFSGHVVENFFDNLLPDSQPLRGRLQARVGAESSRCFDLLTHIGRDCVGALQLLPEDEDADVRCNRATPLSEQAIETILQNYRTMPLGIDLEADFRISIAGAQEKTAFLFYANQWCRPQGATPTSHLFKLPIATLAKVVSISVKASKTNGSATRFCEPSAYRWPQRRWPHSAANRF
jgi:serine/threonine-protein kinase HipA